MLGQQSRSAPRDTDQPTLTISTAGAISLVRPSIILYYGQSDAQAVETPLSRITARARKHGLVQPTLVEYYGNSDAADVDQPLPTVTAKARHGLANPTLVQVNHGNGPQGHRGNDRRVQDLDDPLPSITTSPELGMAQPYIVPNFGERAEQEPRTHDIRGPVPTITSRGAGNLWFPDWIRTRSATPSIPDGWCSWTDSLTCWTSGSGCCRTPSWPGPWGSTTRKPSMSSTGTSARSPRRSATPCR